MLQSEFYERTKVNLTGDEYARVEKMYLATEMDKDIFCQEWLKHHDDLLVMDLMHTIISLQDEVKGLESALKEETERIHELEKQREMDINNIGNMCKNRIEELARKTLKGIDERNMFHVYDTIEEELGLPFIIKSKREMGLEITDSEIDYMVSKL